MQNNIATTQAYDPTNPSFATALRPYPTSPDTLLQFAQRPVQISLRNHQRRREHEHVAPGDLEAHGRL